jgi:uncharacterized membrane protein
MTHTSPLPAVLAYIPVIGWLYVAVFQRGNEDATFHLRQSVGLVLFLASVFAGWVIISTMIGLIPYMAALGMGLFTLVMAAFMYGFVAWLMGMNNALRRRLEPLPLFGKWANRLPIR